MPRPETTLITDAEMRAQWARTPLGRDGMAYDKGITIPGIRMCLLNAVVAARRIDQRRAMAHPTTHYKEVA